MLIIDIIAILDHSHNVSITLESIMQGSTHNVVETSRGISFFNCNYVDCNETAIVLLEERGYRLDCGVDEYIISQREETKVVCDILRSKDASSLPSARDRRKQMKDAVYNNSRFESTDEFFNSVSKRGRHSDCKKPWLRQMMRQMDVNGMIGNHRVEIGCGSQPFTWSDTSDKRLVLIDRGDPEIVIDDFTLLVKADVDEDPNLLQRIDIASHLRNRIDIILCSQLINYVSDVRGFIRSITEQLVSGGHLVIFNCPCVTYREFQGGSEGEEYNLMDRVDNAQLLGIIDDIGMQIEILLADEYCDEYDSKKWNELRQAYIFLVAVKE